MAITREIQRALVALRLQRELGLARPEFRDAAARVSALADRALDRGDFAELPRHALADLSGVAAAAPADAERVLDDVLTALHLASPAPAQDLELVEDAIWGALARAATIDRFEDARSELEVVGALVGGALRVSSRDRAPLSLRIEALVRDFDHVDEPGVLRAIHDELRAGTYRPWFGPRGARARLRWLAPEEGGRASIPMGPRYSTAARLEAVADLWPGEAWSVVVTFDPGAAPAPEMEVGVELLVAERAPPGALAPGTWFELYEGARRVAVGTVLDE